MQIVYRRNLVGDDSEGNCYRFLLIVGVDTEPMAVVERCRKIKVLFFLKNVVREENDMVWTDELYYEVYHLKEDFSKYMNLYYIG